VPSVPSTDGVVLALHDLGGTGPTVLFSHATGFHALVWRPLAQHLAPSYHGAAVDYRAHGDSVLPEGVPVHWNGFGADASAAAAALGCRPGAPGFGVGHSMGGAALLMAELAAPGTFRGLVLFEPIVMPPDLVRPEGGSQMPAVARRRRAEFATRDEAIANFASKPPLNTLRADALAAYVEHGFRDTPEGTVRLKCLPEHEAQTYEMSGSHDTFARLGEVQCAVLVMSGRDEPMQPAAWAENVAQAIPNGHFERHDELGHMGPLEAPDLVGDVVDRFFSAIS